MLAIALVYLAGIPFAAGILGEKCSKGDWAFAIGMGVLSWFGVVLFIGVFFLLFAATKIYSAGMWVSERLGAMNW